MNYQGYLIGDVDKEVPQGLINGSNTVFTITKAPINNSEYLYLNGVLLERGGDYTLSGTTLNLIVVPQTGDKLVISYRR